MAFLRRFAVSLALAACSATSPAAKPPTDAATTCTANGALPGVAYDVSKSRFAFGGKPVKTTTSSITHWTGPHGALAIFSNGETLASLDGNAPENDIAALTGSVARLDAYVRDYYATMGLPMCQIASDSTVSSSASSGDDSGVTSGATTVGLKRAFGSIPIPESQAYAEFDVDYETTSEGFFWPEIPASVVSAATALQAKLATPEGLAAYKAKLPSNAQGDGQVVIHHSSGSEWFMPFVTVATYDVVTTGDAGDAFDDEDLDASFDANGKRVTLPD